MTSVCRIYQCRPSQPTCPVCAGPMPANEVYVQEHLSDWGGAGDECCSPACAAESLRRRESKPWDGVIYGIRNGEFVPL